MTDVVNIGGGAVAPQPPYSQAERIMDLDRRLMAGYREAVEEIRWWDAARPHAISHVRRHAKRLGRGYDGLKQGMVGDPFHEWLDVRAKELREWQKQLHALPDNTGKILGLVKKVPGAAGWALYVLPLIGIPIGVGSFSALVIAAINACFCTLIKILPVAVTWAVSMTLIYGFTHNRDFLLGGTKDGRLSPSRVPEGANLYEIERSLEVALGQRPSGEIQIDVLGWFALAIFFYFWNDIIRLFSGEHFVTFTIGPYVYAAAFAFIGVITLVRSLHRRWAWRPEPVDR